MWGPQPRHRRPPERPGPLARATRQLCFVSVYGFTPEARARVEAEDIRLKEAGDFTRFLLSGKSRDRLRQKLARPNLDAGGDEP